MIRIWDVQHQQCASVSGAFSIRVFAFQVKDQQEAERKKMASQEIQQALEAQTKVISEKQESVRNDLAQVEPAVIEAQLGKICWHTHQFNDDDYYHTTPVYDDEVFRKVFTV